MARPLELPARARVVAVGGATLGGSGKTPLAIACAAELAASGVRTAVVGHGYGATVRRTRVVAPDDSVEDVGDEALLAARALGGRARVVVGPTRGHAVAFAAEWADVLVLDGVAQTTPRRASLALLAVDGVLPWGRAGACPPLGDLRAPHEMLLAACDAVVTLDGSAPGIRVGGVVWAARVVSRGARRRQRPSQPCTHSGADEAFTWDRLRPMRVGLVTALARPDRVVRYLARRGIVARAVLCERDHGPLRPRTVGECREAARRNDLELWLATPKCALHAERHGASDLGAPLATLEYSVVLPSALCARLRGLGLP